MLIPGQVWGATPTEIAAELPCDTELSGRVSVCDRAVAVDAPPEIVFGWICQLRVAPYSYDLLDNWGRRSPGERNPELTRLTLGDRFMGSFELVNFTPKIQVTLRVRGIAVTYATRPHGNASRLHQRVLMRGPAWLLAPVIAGDFLMGRKQLLTLSELAEREALSG